LELKMEILKAIFKITGFDKNALILKKEEIDKHIKEVKNNLEYYTNTISREKFLEAHLDHLVMLSDGVDTRIKAIAFIDSKTPNQDDRDLLYLFIGDIENKVKGYKRYKDELRTKGIITSNGNTIVSRAYLNNPNNPPVIGHKNSFSIIVD